LQIVELTLYDDPNKIWEVHIEGEGVGFILSCLGPLFSGVRFEVQVLAVLTLIFMRSNFRYLNDSPIEIHFTLVTGWKDSRRTILTRMWDSG
jgi:hypothetical protein